MTIIFHCSNCNKSLKASDAGQIGKCPRCGATTKASDASEKPTWSTKLFGDQVRPKDVIIPLAIIIAAISVRIVVVVVATKYVAELFSFRAFVPFVVVAVTLVATVFSILISTAVGILVMLIQGRMLGTDFGLLGSSILKVVAISLFGPSLLLALLLLTVLSAGQPVWIAALACLFVILGVFALAKWLFEMDVFETIVLCLLLLFTHAILSRGAAWLL